MLLLSALAAAMGLHISGTAREVFYTGECKPGVVLSGRPAVGRRILVRPGNVNSSAKPVAEAVVSAEGTYELNVIGSGEFCIVPDQGYNPVGPCLEKFHGAVEGQQKVDLSFASLEQRSPPQCPKVTGEVLFAVDPCGDDGKKPVALGGKILTVTNESTSVSTKVGTDPNGKFMALLFPGKYCFRAERGSDAYVPEACRQGCDARIEFDGKADVHRQVIVHQTCGNPCVKTPFKPEVPTARGIARVAMKGARHHVRGIAFTPPLPERGCGARFPAVPPRPHPGTLVSVFSGREFSSVPVAQVITDSTGFDVALPEGTYCFAISSSSLGRCNYSVEITPSSSDFENIRLIPQTPPAPRCPPGVP